MKNIILASSSPYRKDLFERLKIPFLVKEPHIDETPLRNESADELVRRLSISKAQTIGKTEPGSICIGSDEMVSVNGEIIGKPGNFENAFQQLWQINGKTIRFHTGVCVYQHSTQICLVDVIHGEVKLKTLTEKQIETYLRKEQPFNSTASFHFEGLGITIIEKFTGNDPTAVIGLPLIRLSEMLEEIEIKA